MPLTKTAITPIYLIGQEAQKEVSNLAPILNDFLIKVYSKKASEAKIFASFARNYGGIWKQRIVTGPASKNPMPPLMKSGGLVFQGPHLFCPNSTITGSCRILCGVQLRPPQAILTGYLGDRLTEFRSRCRPDSASSK
ncbi:MAG: hypothetical protein AMJ43_00660 [Coxiella sp. DG_40]|nr:MAG: hypothetical protein AMJ43_00660 [Coxiella sp. DG_40]